MSQNGASAVSDGEGGVANPFGVGNGLVSGGGAGPQTVQHGSGATVRNAPGGGTAGGLADVLNWGRIFTNLPGVGGAVSGGGEASQNEGGSGESGGKRAKGADGGRSLSPRIGKFRTKVQKNRGDRSPMIQPGGKKVWEAPTVTVEPPPGMSNGGGAKREASGEKMNGGTSATTGEGWNGGINFGEGPGENGGNGVTREELYGAVWGLTQGWKGGKGNGNGDGNEFHLDLDERQFRRVDKYRGEKDKFKGWLYEIFTGIGVLNTKLQREVKELMKTYREEDKSYREFDMEEEEEVNRERYEYYKGQLYRVLVSLIEGGTEARIVRHFFYMY